MHKGLAAHGGPQAPQLELMDLLRVHTDQYAAHAKDTYMAMVGVWADLEVEPDQQQQELQEAMQAAVGCWTSTLDGLRGRQQALRDTIQAALSSIMAIKGELGADNPGADAELQKLQGNRSGHRTLKAWEQDVLVKAAYWEQCRKQRVADYEDLQARIKLLRQLCGLPPQPPPLEKPDISRSNMEFLRLELERLATEKERREDLLRGLLEELSSVCRAIGEDVKAAVLEVHENLVFLWDAEATKVLRDVYRLGSSYTSAGCGCIDLGDNTISRLSTKLTIMKDLKASRDAHATEVVAVLTHLWDATEVPDVERAHFVGLMSGALRLHASSLEKCMAEVRRLEDVRYQQMVDLVVGKGEELAALCADSHVEQPAGLAAALEAIDANDRNPGAAAELLAKLLAMLAEVQVLASKRSTIIAAINEVEGARQEELWLAAYEADDQRYKGRDANKKLQRAIRAGKLRDKLPSLIEELRGLLTEWKDCEGEAFLFDGRDYQFEVLDGLAAAVEEAAAARAAKAAAATSKRRQSLAGGAPGLPSSPGSASSTPRKSVPVPASGAGGPPLPPGGRVRSAAASPAPPRRVGGPPTPMVLRGVSNRSLTERHSICVVRDREADGPAGLSRSGEVRLRPASGHSAGGHNSSSSRGAAGAAALGCRGSSEGTAAAALAAAAGGRRRSSADGLGGSARRGSSEGVGAAGSSLSPAPATTSGSSFSTPPRRSSTGGGGRDVTPASSGSSGGARPTPSCGAPPAAGGSSGESLKRPNTSSKLDSIFRRGSVQHAVARLSSEPSGRHTDSAGAADQDV